MRWTREGLMEPTSIIECATLHRSVVPVCRCGHSAGFEPHGLWWHFNKRGWSDALNLASERFWCRLCSSSGKGKQRPMRIDVREPDGNETQLPWPDQRAWKKAMARLR